VTSRKEVHLQLLACAIYAGIT